MTCPKCQKQVNDRTVFCPHCGARVQTAIRKSPIQQPAPQRSARPLPQKPSFSLPSFQPVNTDLKHILAYVACGCSLLSMILWLTIGFKIDVGLSTQDFSLYTYFFKQSHTTFLSVFVVLGLIAHIACTLVPMLLRLPYPWGAVAKKIALQSLCVSYLLGILALNAALATSDHELLSYMNFSGWACFIFMLASLAITLLLFFRSKDRK